MTRTNNAIAGVPSISSVPQSKENMADPWWQGATIYQIYPRSFLDTNGDGIGDLPGITQKLPYVASLGVDAVWLSPFFTSPMDDFGYDVADFCDVDPMFGTLSDFDELLKVAHDLGLKIIIDQVYSHTSDQHKWFAESRMNRTNAKSDWYVWADPKPDGTPPNNWQSVFGGPAWQWDSRRQQYYLHNFLTSQPDLNVHNPAVQDALLDTARFWLDRGVDGFRLDALNFAMHDPELRDNPVATQFARPPTRPFDYQQHTRSMSHPGIPGFIKRIRAVLDEYPDRFTVAEVGGAFSLGEMKAFTADNEHLNSAYSFDYLYADRLTPALVAKTAGEWNGSDGEGWPSWAFSNHDAPRSVSRWGTAENRIEYAKTHGLLLLSLRGNAFIYQGEELGMSQANVPFSRLQDPEAIANWPETLGRDGARTPMPWQHNAPNAGFSAGEPWLPVDPVHFDQATDLQENAADSPLNFYRQAIAFRNTHPALHHGDFDLLEATEMLIAFRRRSDDETLTCIFNLGNAPAELNPSVYGEILLSTDPDMVGEPLPRVIPGVSGYIVRSE